MNTEKHYCTFFVNNLLFGLELLKVQEILSDYQVTPVPLAPKTVAGLVNHRGQIATVIDLRKCFGFPDSACSTAGPMHIACGKDEPVGLLVDRINDVLSVNFNDFEPAPNNLHGSARDLIEGAYKLADRLLLPLRLESVAGIAQAS